jgi:hypothetical protein
MHVGIRRLLALCGALVVLVAPLYAQPPLPIEKRPITGRVVDERGAPITGATIKYSMEEGGGLSATWTLSLKDGSFTMNRFRDGVPGFFSVVAKGYAPVIRVVPEDDLAAPLTFTLPAGHRITGRVVDDGGKSVVGARVAWRVTPAEEQMPDEFRYRFHLEQTNRTQASTDKNGRFVVDSLPAGEVTLAVSAGEALEGVADSYPVDTTQTITLRRLGKIVGRVVRQKDGKPVAKFSVMVALPGGRLISGGHPSADGRFVRFWARPGGTMTLIIDAPGYTQARLERVTFSLDPKPLLIRLAPAKHLVGHITDKATGKPLAGALVSAVTDNSGPTFAVGRRLSAGSRAQAQSDSRGRFAVEARRDRVDITVEKSGYAHVFLQNLDIASQPKIALARGATIKGQTPVGERDRGPRMARLTPIGGWENMWEPLKADGSYAFTELPAGSYSVTEHSLPQRATTVAVKPGETVTIDWDHRAAHAPAGATAVLRGTVTLTGKQGPDRRIIAGSTRPGAGVGVSLTPSDGGGGVEAAPTDARGQYELGPVVPGDYLLSVSVGGGNDPGGFTVTRRLTLPEGDNQFDLQRLCAVSGRLVDAETGKPLAQTHVGAFVHQDWSETVGLGSQSDLFAGPIWTQQGGGITDDQGRFIIGDLAPGEWMIARINERRQAVGVVVPPFTLGGPNQSMEVAAQSPEMGAAEVTIVDAETGKAIPGAAAVCVDRWGSVVRADWTPPTSRMTPEVVALPGRFATLAAGEYTAYPDLQFGHAQLAAKYPPASVPFTVKAGETTKVSLPLTRGGRVIVKASFWGKDSELSPAAVYRLTRPGSDEPVLADAYGPRRGGMLFPQADGKAYLALAPGDYHLELRVVTVPRPGFGLSEPLATGPVVLSQDITIIAGQDLVLTVKE